MGIFHSLFPSKSVYVSETGGKFLEISSQYLIEQCHVSMHTFPMLYRRRRICLAVEGEKEHSGHRLSTRYSSMHFAKVTGEDRHPEATLRTKESGLVSMPIIKCFQDLCTCLFKRKGS